MADHSPGPWKVRTNVGGTWIEDANGGDVCMFPFGEPSRAEAERVVRAVNGHDAMLAELKSLEWRKDGNRYWRCAECGGFHPDEVIVDETGHKPGCRIGALIARAEGRA